MKQSFHANPLFFWSAASRRRFASTPSHSQPSTRRRPVATHKRTVIPRSVPTRNLHLLFLITRHCSTPSPKRKRHRPRRPRFNRRHLHRRTRPAHPRSRIPSQHQPLRPRRQLPIRKKCAVILNRSPFSRVRILLLLLFISHQPLATNHCS